MDQPPTVAFTAFADVWPRATETEIGAALCAFGVGRTLTLTSDNTAFRFTFALSIQNMNSCLVL